MKDNKNIGGNKREQINKDGKVVKSTAGAIITGAAAVGLTALAMLKPKTIISIGPFVLAKAGKIAAAKLIASGVIAGTAGAATGLVTQKSKNSANKSSNCSDAVSST